MEINWVLILGVAVSALGLIQYLKGIFKKAPSVVWSVALPVVVIGMSLVFTYIQFLGIAMLALSIAQLGYDALLKKLLQLVGVSQEQEIRADAPAPNPTQGQVG